MDNTLLVKLIEDQLPLRVRENFWVDVRKDAYGLRATAAFYRRETIEKLVGPLSLEGPIEPLLRCFLEPQKWGMETILAKVPDAAIGQLCLENVS